LVHGLVRIISPLEAERELDNLWGVTTAVANALAKLTKRQKLALAARLQAEAKGGSSTSKAGRKAKVGRPQFVRSKITGMIVSEGPKGAPRVTSEQVRALLADFP